jgi:hypothetical protein
MLAYGARHRQHRVKVIKKWMRDLLRYGGNIDMCGGLSYARSVKKRMKKQARKLSRELCGETQE